MNEKKFSERDLRFTHLLSAATTNFDKYVILLKHNYGFSLTKSNLAEVLHKSEQTIDRRIKEGSNIPEYIKSGEGSRASYIFPIGCVAEYLVNTIKVR